jgi:hypothetical protein
LLYHGHEDLPPILNIIQEGCYIMVMKTSQESRMSYRGIVISWSSQPPTNPVSHTGGLLYHGHDDLPRIPNIIQEGCYIMVMKTSHESRMSYRGIVISWSWRPPTNPECHTGGCYIMVMMTSHESRKSYRGVGRSWPWWPPTNPGSHTRRMENDG